VFGFGKDGEEEMMMVMMTIKVKILRKNIYIFFVICLFFFATKQYTT